MNDQGFRGITQAGTDGEQWYDTSGWDVANLAKGQPLQVSRHHHREAETFLTALGGVFDTEALTWTVRAPDSVYESGTLLYGIVSRGMRWRVMSDDELATPEPSTEER
jgi:hypothetical protein